MAIIIGSITVYVSMVFVFAVSALLAYIVWRRSDTKNDTALIVTKAAVLLCLGVTLLLALFLTVYFIAQLMGGDILAHVWTAALLFYLASIRRIHTPVLDFLSDVVLEYVFVLFNVWIENGHRNSVMYASRGRWVMFWGTGSSARGIISKWVALARKKIAEERGTGDNRWWNVPNPRFNFTGGWAVPQEAQKFVYEGIMHDEQNPHCISTLCVGGPLAGTVITDT